MTTAPEMPRDGLLLPAFELPAAGGGTVRVRSLRGRRSLALIFAHDAACAGCRAFLTSALERYAEYAEHDAQVIAIVPARVEAADAVRRSLGLPFPIAADADGAVLRRYSLTPGVDAAVMIADRYGEPRLWHRAGPEHGLPEHDALIAELRYLSLTCSGGAPTPLWQDP